MSEKPLKRKGYALRLYQVASYFYFLLLLPSSSFRSDTIEPTNVQHQLKRRATQEKEKKRATRCAAEKRKAYLKKNTPGKTA